MHKKIIVASLLFILIATSITRLECSCFNNKQEPDTEFIARIQKTPHVKIPDYLCCVDRKHVVDYHNYGITQADLSHEVKKSLKNMPTIQEGFKLTHKNLDLYLKNNVPLEYFDAREIEDALSDTHDKALQSIRSDIEQQLSRILIKILDSSDIQLDSVNEHDQQILKYVTEHKEFGFQIPEVVEYMIGTNKCKSCVAHFILNNIRFKEPVKDINQQSTRNISNIAEQITSTNIAHILTDTILENKPEVAKLLFAAGADIHQQITTVINTTTQNQKTLTQSLLATAAFYNNLEAIKLLLDAGADAQQSIKIKSNGIVIKEISLVAYARSHACNQEIINLLSNA